MQPVHVHVHVHVRAHVNMLRICHGGGMCQLIDSRHAPFLLARRPSRSTRSPNSGQREIRCTIPTARRASCAWTRPRRISSSRVATSACAGRAASGLRRATALYAALQWRWRCGSISKTANGDRGHACTCDLMTCFICVRLHWIGIQSAWLW